ncbi:Gfo/Idh/MocA family oxidoreductase [Shimia sp.]|uniref:Gfo/Idh/MocA family oxidoreductase n=1 Tax=Shimia sp. TaxID=1954381 RepID=UPI003BA8FA1F
MAKSQPTNGQKARIAIAGFGLVGRRHAAAIGFSRSATLVSVVDPRKDVAAEVTSFGARYYQNLADLMSDDKPDGIDFIDAHQVAR